METIPNLDLPTLIDRLKQAKAIMPADMPVTVKLELINDSALLLRYDFYEDCQDHFHLFRAIDIYNLQYAESWTAFLDEFQRASASVIQKRKRKSGELTCPKIESTK